MWPSLSMWLTSAPNEASSRKTSIDDMICDSSEKQSVCIVSSPFSIRKSATCVLPPMTAIYRGEWPFCPGRQYRRRFSAKPNDNQLSLQCCHMQRLTSVDIELINISAPHDVALNLIDIASEPPDRDWCGFIRAVAGKEQ